MRHEKLIVPDRGAAEPISFGAAVRQGKKVAPDVIDLLVLDHLEAMAFFERYRLAPDEAAKRSVLARLCGLLSVHMQVEEEIFYPAAQTATGDSGMVDHAEEEHAQAKALIGRLEEAGGGPDDALVQQLMLAIQQHVAEEETRFFPEVRERGSLDLYELGRMVAARRVELLMDMTGRTPKEGQMQTSDMDVAMTGDLGREMDARPVDPDQARQLFIAGLKNAHALEQNCQTMVRRQLDRLEHYPKVKARLEQHRTENEAQIARLEQILEQLGESPSGLKDMAMSMQAEMGAMMHAAAGDEILKNSLLNAAVAQMEVASYKSLLVMGEAAGETAAIRQLQKSLSEERAMAAWLEENLPGTVIAHLQMRGQGGVDASR